MLPTTNKTGRPLHFCGKYMWQFWQIRGKKRKRTNTWDNTEEHLQTVAWFGLAIWQREHTLWVSDWVTRPSKTIIRPGSNKRCVCCCRRSWSCSDKSLSEKIERNSWGLPPRGLGLLALRDGNAGWSPLWGCDPSKTNCGYPGKKQGAPRRWGYRPAVRAPVPNLDARERADALLEVPRGLSSSPSSWWSYVIARFVCLLPIPLGLKLVSNKHFHTFTTLTSFTRAVFLWYCLYVCHCKHQISISKSWLGNVKEAVDSPKN